MVFEEDKSPIRIDEHFAKTFGATSTTGNTHLLTFRLASCLTFGDTFALLRSLAFPCRISQRSLLESLMAAVMR